MKYEPTIGLEIHSELKTKSKMFCDCLNDPLEKNPNINICPVCTAQPGSLPVINYEAVRAVIKTGLALGCKVNGKNWFERKNYFYPDLPKGYQISQYEAPLCVNGELNNIKIRRIHLEEDTGKSIHDQEETSLVDYNRAGVPLMELVTEPDIHGAEQASKFAQELQLILRYLGVSDADMEKGQMRVEANISLNMGTKVEVKNLNSFKNVEGAIKYEIERQKEVLEAGEQVIHETRGWNDNKQETFSQRAKETSDDYRYFPEPDLPPLKISKKEISELKDLLPELPIARRKRFLKEYKLPEQNIEILTTYKYLGVFFEETISELQAWLKSGKTCLPVGKVKTDFDKLVKLGANYIITEFPKYVSMGSEIKITAENFAELIYLTFIGEISSSGTQEVLREMFKIGGDPSQIIESKNLKQVSDIKWLEEAAEKIIKNNSQTVEDYKRGKETALQFLIGQIMKETKGRANPGEAGKVLRHLLTK